MSTNKYTLEQLKARNQNSNHCVSCGKPLQEMDLVFKVVKGCPSCESKFSKGQSPVQPAVKTKTSTLLAKLVQLETKLKARGYICTLEMNVNWGTRVGVGHSITIEKAARTYFNKEEKNLGLPLWKAIRADLMDTTEKYFWEK